MKQSGRANRAMRNSSLRLTTRAGRYHDSRLLQGRALHNTRSKKSYRFRLFFAASAFPAAGGVKLTPAGRQD
jgi:hypothetical protein